MYSKNSLVSNIFCAISYLVHEGVQVTVLCIPGICGNKLADRVAKAALEFSLCTKNVPPSDQ